MRGLAGLPGLGRGNGVRRAWRTHKEIRTLLDVAAGRRTADLYLDGGALLNVYSGELYPANILEVRSLGL